MDDIISKTELIDNTLHSPFTTLKDFRKLGYMPYALFYDDVIGMYGLKDKEVRPLYRQYNLYLETLI